MRRTFIPNPEARKFTRQLVYRVTEAGEVKGDWERRIIELGDGKSIGEIIEILYREETRRGAWVDDIGLWRNLFDQCVVKTIRELIDMGHIYLKPDGGSLEGTI